MLLKVRFPIIPYPVQFVQVTNVNCCNRRTFVIWPAKRKSEEAGFFGDRMIILPFLKIFTSVLFTYL